jgi:hypothetical protein
MIQKMDQSMMNKIVVNEPSAMSYSRRWGSSFSSWYPGFSPSLNIDFYSPVGGKATVTVLSSDGKEINEMSSTVSKGFNTMPYDVSMTEKGKKAMLSGLSKIGIDKAQNGVYYLPVGTYTIKVDVAGQSGSTTLEIK